jgi:peptidoglycan/xylan/chitin deacetylase (PgdA/CDA1 family)
MYHRVATYERDPGFTKVQPENFAAHMEILTRVADVVPLTSILDRAPGWRVALTFDDGYADNAEVARPILEQARIAATFFIPSNVVIPGHAFWWDHLEHLLLDAELSRPRLDLEIGGRPISIDIRTPEGRQRAHDVIRRRARSRPSSEINCLLDQIREQVGEPGTEWRPPKGLSTEALRELAQGGLIDIGGHTRSHVMLSAIDRSKQWCEISECKTELECVVGRPVTTFAYPFGTPDTFGPETQALVHEAGFKLACSTDQSLITRRTQPLRIPRLAVYDWDGEEFARRLTHALRGELE